MNKIVVDKENNLSINDDNILLSIKVKKLTLNLSGEVVINDFSSNDDLELNLKINKNSNVVYNKFNILNDNKFDIKITCLNDSNIEFNYSSLILGNVSGVINTIFKGNNINSSINYRAVTDGNGQIRLVSDVNLSAYQEENEFLESLHVLLLNDKTSEVVPNLNVESDKVVANHEATIAGIDKNYLHYLQSKGLKEELAVSLVKEGYLISNLKCNKEYKHKLKEILINRR